MKRIFYIFSIGKEKLYLKSLRKLLLYFSQINIYIFKMCQQEMSDIILHDNSSTTWSIFAGLLRLTFAISAACNLLDWLHAICLIRHGQPYGLAHFKQLQGDGKSAGINVSLMISGTKSSSSFKLYLYWGGPIEMSSIKGGWSHK